MAYIGVNMPFTPSNVTYSTGDDNYMRFEKGENRFRVLSEPIGGYLYWVDKDDQVVPRGELGGEGAKPIRVKHLTTVKHKGAQYDAKPFVTAIVWHFKDSKIKILEITQKTIMKSLDALADSEDWGNPFTSGYDITVSRSGDGLETEYSVVPSQPRDVVIDMQKVEAINLEALYEGKDPFAEELTEEELAKLSS